MRNAGRPAPLILRMPPEAARICRCCQRREHGKGSRMVNSRVLQIVRQFWENAVKLLLENPQNVRDLLALAGADVVKRVDLRRVELVRTTFVERDYRHVESDIVLVAPLRRRRGERTARRVLIYILVEHQSEPDRLMPLRSLDYVVQISIM